MSMASRWQRFLTVSAMAVALAAAGCKSGTSWNAKPSWWSFGGSGEDPAKLAAAPAASTDVTKPSASAKPYPTTSTPEGYSLAGTQPSTQATAQAAPAAVSPASEPAVVTYGSTPPASAAPAATGAPQQVAAAPTSSGLSGITPQVGPYRGAAGTPADTPMPSAVPASSAAFAPPAEPTATAVAPASAFGAAAATASAAPPASPDPLAVPAGTRVADTRVADGWSAAPATPGSRYGDASSSRFAGAPPAAAERGWTPQATTATSPAAATSSPLGTPVPSALQAPAALPPAGLPAAPATPTRRPDPGYRPGGTSSYRPSRTILADDAPADPSPVRQVSFETAIPPESSPVVR